MKKTIKVNFEDLPQTFTPVLDYCRKLISEGEKPNSKLEVYRKIRPNEPDIISTNIGISAQCTVGSSSTGRPIFKNRPL